MLVLAESPEGGTPEPIPGIGSEDTILWADWSAFEWMPMLTAVMTEQEIQAGSEDQAEAPPSGTSGFWFMSACLVLPVLWGLLVHRLFRYFRGRQAEREWSDYQI